MPKWIIGVAAVTLIAAILGVGALFMSTGPFLNQSRDSGAQAVGNEATKP